MEQLNEGLTELLIEAGADLVGFADLSHLDNIAYPVGISVAVKLPIEVVIGISDGPTEVYFKAYESLSAKLDYIIGVGERYLLEQGFKAYANSTERVKVDENNRSVLPHKTVATLGGLGWIGKSALLITKQFGGAQRLSSLLTDAPLKCNTPVTLSYCKSCEKCTKACPGGAISGREWTPQLDRDQFFNHRACRQAARRLAQERINREITLCGKCFEVCPYTKAYINNG